MTVAIVAVGRNKRSILLKFKELRLLEGPAGVIF